MEADIEEEADVVELAPSPVKDSKPIDIIWDDDKIEKVCLAEKFHITTFLNFTILTKNTVVY
jgi:hypothetical protein